MDSTTVLGMTAGHWETWANVATVLASIVVVISAPSILWQLIEARRSRDSQSFISVLEQLQSEEVRAARRIVFTLSEKPLARWTPEERVAAEKVCHTYGTVGIMVRNKLLHGDLILDNWLDSIRSIWPIVRPLVLEYRQNRSGPTWHNFEWLAWKASTHAGAADAFAVPSAWDARQRKP